MKRISEALKQQIIEEFDKGLNSTMIGEKLNVSEFTARKYIKESGRLLPNRRKHCRVLKTDEEEQLAKQMYTEGKTFTDIANYFNCSVTAIRDLMVSLGTKSRGQKDLNGNYLSRKYTVDHDYFENIDTPNKAYWLGMMYADGNNNEERKVVTLGQCENHLDILEKYNTCLLSNYPIKLQRKGGEGFFKDKKVVRQNFYAIRFSSKKMSSDLAKHGVVQNKTLKVKFPTIPKELYSHFIRGYFDGDGSISFAPNLKTCSWNLVGTLELLQGIQNCLIEQELSETKISKARENSKVYQLIYGGRHNLEKIYRYLYEDAAIYLEPKKQKFEKLFELFDTSDISNQNTKENKENDIIKLLQEGKSFNSICKKLHTSKETINEVINKNSHLNLDKDKILNDKIKTLLAKGYSARKIEKELNTSRKRVSKVKT